ncbi:hypothetical protein C2G38_2045879 [Gigaspora rosea]|uniref:Uncharacterized protein n=1 Tax=Gigaspora rosea TaxID=44941 RepID=A0A397UBB6_9GLOM|nr:hypothetical protein C2G38_2045879 [Gigaspora rosea]
MATPSIMILGYLGVPLLRNFYMVFNQEKLLYGISFRSDIDYGPTPIPTPTPTSTTPTPTLTPTPPPPHPTPTPPPPPPPPPQDHTFWISNHLVRGTIAQVAALRDRPDSWNWLTKPGAIAYGHSSAHDGFNLQISGVYSYWIVFGVAESTEQDKWRGRFDNKQDYCYHYTGNEFKWDVFPC